ncbi:transposase [Robinsoniella peoriensis]|uniref:transposase n=1 Tax=Robinsoniella peoriensis TaxID=180332 RepID=UPI0023EA504E|nr:transposase [Robinsoniella peoriensis]
MLQQFFSRSPFDEQSLLNVYQKMLFRQIDAQAGALSVDDTSFVKKEYLSVGVKRQYCGRLGKTENCQSGISKKYARLTVFLLMPETTDMDS